MWVVIIAVSALVSFLLSCYYAGNQINYSLSEISFNSKKPTIYEVVEYIFWIDFLLKFFTEYPDEGGKTLTEDSKVVRDPLKILKRYLNSSQFLFDVIPLIPFSFFLKPKRTGIQTLNSYDYFYLVYILKCLRINKTVDYFSPKFINGLIKNLFDTTRNNIIEKFAIDGDTFSPLIDYNKISEQFKILQLFKAIRLLISILIFAYAFGHLWLIIVSCEMKNGFSDAMEFDEEA